MNFSDQMGVLIQIIAELRASNSSLRERNDRLEKENTELIIKNLRLTYKLANLREDLEDQIQVADEEIAGLMSSVERLTDENNKLRSAS